MTSRRLWVGMMIVNSTMDARTLRASCFRQSTRARREESPGYHPAPTLPPAYSIVVVTWQCASALKNLVASMNRYLDEAPELVIVDNGSGDRPEEAARGWKGVCRFIQTGTNLGFGPANNVGVEAASGAAVVLLNPDVELLDGSLETLASEALGLGALVGPRILNPDRSVQPSASGPPTGFWPWIGAVVPGGPSPRWLLAKTEPWRLQERVPVSWLTGACVAAPREMLRSLGPFDPAIHLYSEDLDLGIRAASRGIASYFSPRAATVIHYGKASTRIRFDDLGRSVAALNRRAVLRRAFGARAETASWNAERFRLWLRVAAKRVVRRDSTWDRIVLRATSSAREIPTLSEPGEEQR
jgi:N-acetylglucosaminyl-diphospho-decaprenol L-rhamnosyltransferase